MHTPAPARASISFGYESTGHLTQVPNQLTKAPPVKAWSAPQTEAVQEEITFCQKLTTFVVASTSKVSSLAPESVIDVSAQSIAPPVARHQASAPRSRPRHAVELPRFAMG